MGIVSRAVHGYQPTLTAEEALVRAEQQADAELFQADEDFARALGIELTPLELVCHLRRMPAPPAASWRNKHGSPVSPPEVTAGTFTPIRVSVPQGFPTPLSCRMIRG